MVEENFNMEEWILGYPEEYQKLIRENLLVTDKDLETFIISLIM